MAALSTILALVLVEVCLRLSGYDINIHPHWRYDSTLGWTVDPAQAPWDEIQPSGFRYQPRPEARKRLLILGDSFALGTALPFATTFPGSLQERLSKVDGGWEVVSLSVDDWGTAQQLLALREIGSSMQPDAVVLQVFPFNDLSNNTPLLALTNSLQDAQRPYFRFADGQLRPTTLVPWRSWLRGRLRLFGLAENWFDLGFVDPGAGLNLRQFYREHAARVGLRYESAPYSLLEEKDQPPAIQESWRISEALFQEVDRLLREKGLPLVVVVIPFSGTFDPGWRDLQSEFKLPMAPDYATRRVESFFRRLQRPVLSVRQAIQAGEEAPSRYFLSPQDGHLGPFGHQMVAQWIFEILLEQGIVGSP